MKTFTNSLQLPSELISLRLSAHDPRNTCQAFTTNIHDMDTGELIETQRYVSIAASITDEIIWGILSEPITETDKWSVIRVERNKLLAACDWTQIPDAPLTLEEKQAWSAYRQALRNIPQDFVAPDEVVFPETPA